MPSTRTHFSLAALTTNAPVTAGVSEEEWNRSNSFRSTSGSLPSSVPLSIGSCFGIGLKSILRRSHTSERICDPVTGLSVLDEYPLGRYGCWVYGRRNSISVALFQATRRKPLCSCLVCLVVFHLDIRYVLVIFSRRRRKVGFASRRCGTSVWI